MPTVLVGILLRGSPCHLHVPNACSFCAIVLERFLEPGVTEGFFGRDAVVRVVHKNAHEEVKKLTIKFCALRNGVLGVCLLIGFAR